MSNIAEAPPSCEMTVEAFFARAESWDDGERYERVEGRPERLPSEQINHAEHKFSATLARPNALKDAGLSDCHAFAAGVSVLVGARTVREPGALVRCGPYEGKETIASNPILGMDIISPSSIRSAPGRKLIDCVSVPSIHHDLILYEDEEHVVHHRRTGIEGDIATRILGLGDIVDISPPDISVIVDALFDS